MSIAEELERLQSLQERGALSDEEYARAKARVLGAAPASGTAAPDDASPASFFHRLARSRTDRIIGGVCGGLGSHTGLPAWVWRIIFCISLVYFGAGLLIYLLLWIFVPKEPAITR